MADPVIVLASLQAKFGNDATIGLLYRLKLINAEEFEILDRRVDQIKEQIELECATGRPKREREEGRL